MELIFYYFNSFSDWHKFTGLLFILVVSRQPGGNQVVLACVNSRKWRKLQLTAIAQLLRKRIGTSARTQMEHAAGLAQPVERFTAERKVAGSVHEVEPKLRVLK